MRALARNHCLTTLFVRQVGRHRSWDTLETCRQHPLKQAQIGPPLSGWVGTVIGHTLLERGGVVVSYRTLHRYATTEFGFNQRKTAVRVADCARSAIGRVVHVDSSDDTAWRVCCRSMRVAASTLWAARQRPSGRAHRCHDRRAVERRGCPVNAGLSQRVEDRWLPWLADCGTAIEVLTCLFVSRSRSRVAVDHAGSVACRVL